MVIGFSSLYGSSDGPKEKKSQYFLVDRISLVNLMALEQRTEIASLTNQLVALADLIKYEPTLFIRFQSKY